LKRFFDGLPLKSAAKVAAVLKLDYAVRRNTERIT